MSTMVVELYDALRKAGVDEQLAQNAARAVVGIDTMTELATKTDLAGLKAATTADLAELKAATKADFAELKAATKAEFAEVKGEIALLRSETKVNLAELKAELIKWNVGAMAVLTAIFSVISRLG